MRTDTTVSNQLSAVVLPEWYEQSLARQRGRSVVDFFKSKMAHLEDVASKAGSLPHGGGSRMQHSYKTRFKHKKIIDDAGNIYDSAHEIAKKTGAHLQAVYNAASQGNKLYGHFYRYLEKEHL